LTLWYSGDLQALLAMPIETALLAAAAPEDGRVAQSGLRQSAKRHRTGT
jgi:hypothetical protein